jgi:hypothetical protein
MYLDFRVQGVNEGAVKTTEVLPNEAMISIHQNFFLFFFTSAEISAFWISSCAP